MSDRVDELMELAIVGTYSHATGMEQFSGREAAKKLASIARRAEAAEAERDALADATSDAVYFLELGYEMLFRKPNEAGSITIGPNKAARLIAAHKAITEGAGQ